MNIMDLMKEGETHDNKMGNKDQSQEQALLDR
jgi:hypothetical protein